MFKNHIPKVLRLIIGSALLAGVLLFASPARPASAGGGGPALPPDLFCLYNNWTLSGFYFDPIGFPGKQVTLSSGILPNGQKLKETITEVSDVGGGYWSATVKIVVTGCPGSGFTDGRCNLDAGQPVAVYPDGKGGYNFYAINLSTGYFAMHITAADLAANPDKGTNYLIRQNLGVRLYRLAGGGLQVMRVTPSGTDYKYIISGCA